MFAVMDRIKNRLKGWIESGGDRGVPDILTEEEIAEEARRQEAKGEWIAWPFDFDPAYKSQHGPLCPCPDCQFLYWGE